MRDSFGEDILHGLSSSPKKLPSRYFYDEKGSRIFQEIMEMPEYYLTRAENEILSSHATEITENSYRPGLRIIELGAGDASKTYHLLKAWNARHPDVIYQPLDISEEALRELEGLLKKKLPDLNVETMHGEYFERLTQLQEEGDEHPKLVLFLGSNIGNFNYQGALAFMKQLRKSLCQGDQVLVGIDLKKSPSLILPAYSDKAGITARFNLNLLERINRELGGHFKVGQFRHYASYEPESGEVRSFLISQKDQDVLIEKLNRSFHFKAWENIQTEISRKYSREEFRELAEEAGFVLREQYFDGNMFFMDVLLDVV